MNMVVGTAIAGTAIPTQVALAEAETGPDWQSILGRAEQIVEVLRTRVIHDRWRMDEESERGAEQLLRYCRRMAAGREDDDREWGQS